MSRPVTTLASTLSGMVAGLNVMQTSSKPNSESSTLRIRGTGTLNDSAPLVLVDGMEMSLNNVNPNDIASISILKDAASCAIYGNRGANGVILLTTKKGTDGKINVTYSGKFSYNTPANLIRMASNYADYMELSMRLRTMQGRHRCLAKLPLIRGVQRPVIRMEYPNRAIRIMWPIRIRTGMMRCIIRN